MVYWVATIFIANFFGGLNYPLRIALVRSSVVPSLCPPTAPVACAIHTMSRQYLRPKQPSSLSRARLAPHVAIVNSEAESMETINAKATFLGGGEQSGWRRLEHRLRSACQGQSSRDPPRRWQRGPLHDIMYRNSDFFLKDQGQRSTCSRGVPHGPRLAYLLGF